MRVKRGQVWSLVKGSGGRMDVTVLSVRGPVVRAIVARTGVKLTLRRATIEQGFRGARLVSPQPVLAAQKNRRAKPKAKAPRVLTPPTPTSDKVLRLYEEDSLTLARIAERLGMSRSMAQTHLTRAKAARQASHVGAP